MTNTMTLAKPKGMSWVSPYIIVKDVDSSINFYKAAFGFHSKEVIPDEDGITMHAELIYKQQVIMFGKEGKYENLVRTPANSGVESPITIYLYCDDVDSFYQHAIKAGANSEGAPEDMFWGDRICRLKDLDGYIWCFATHVG